jgi:hypothetical protein
MTYRIVSRKKLSILAYQARQAFSIKRFLRDTNKAGVIMDITKRFFHVDLFLQIAMQEGGFNIHLMDLPFM